MEASVPAKEAVILYEFVGQITGQSFLMTDEELGAGSFATVYKGYFKNDKSIPVAIKMTRRNANYQPERYRKYLDREIEFVKKSLSHPNVLQFIDYYDPGDNNKVFIAMEFCDAGTLKSYMTQQQRLSEQEIQFFFAQIVRGLKYLHDNDIIHRDLKPENFLLKKEVDGKLSLKISDFGLAREVVTEEDTFRMTLLGTPAYVSPEIYGAHPYGFATDIWGLGAILFEMLENKYLLTPQDIAAMKQHVVIDFTPRFNRARSLPDVLDILKRLLSSDPKDRCSLQWLLDHNYIRGLSYSLQFQVFSVNRAINQYVTVRVSPTNFVVDLFDELNAKVPPFIKGSPAVSVFGAASSIGADKPRARPVPRMYLCDDGTPIQDIEELEELMKKRLIYMYHLEDANDDIVVEDDFVLVDSSIVSASAVPGGANRAPGGIIDEVNRQIILRSKQGTALQVLNRHCNKVFTALEQLQQSYDLDNLVKQQREKLKNLMVIKLKDLAMKIPSAAFDLMTDFWATASQFEELSRKLDLVETEKKRLLDKLRHAQEFVAALTNSVERAELKRNRLRDFSKSASLIDAQMVNSLKDWVVDDLVNRDRLRGIRSMVSTIVRSHLAIDANLVTLEDVQKTAASLSETVARLQKTIQSRLDEYREKESADTAQLTNLRELVSQHQLLLAVADEKRVTAEAQRDELQLQLDALSGRLAMLDEVLIERNTLLKEVRELTSERESTLKTVRELGESLEVLKQEYLEKENSLKDHYDIQMASYATSQEEHVRALEAELEDLKHQLARIQAASLSQSALTQSQGESMVDMILSNLDEKNKELVEAKQELQIAQQNFVDEKREKRLLREQLDRLVPLEEQVKSLMSEIQQAQHHIKFLEDQRICFSDFQEHSTVAFRLHENGFYYMLYEPVLTAAEYCWVLLDPDVEAQLPATLPIVVADLLTVPDFASAMKVDKYMSNRYKIPVDVLYVTVLVQPRIELSKAFTPPDLAK